MKTKMPETKKNHDEYDSFDVDDKTHDEGKGEGCLAWLKRRLCCCCCCCGCCCPKKEDPLLSNKVNHRKISRVESTDSLSKDTTESQDRLYDPLTRQPRPASALSSHREAEFNRHAWPLMPPLAAPRRTQGRGRAPGSIRRQLPNPNKFSTNPFGSTLSLDTDVSTLPSPHGSPRRERSDSLSRQNPFDTTSNASTSTRGSPDGTPSATPSTTPRSLKHDHWGAVVSSLDAVIKSRQEQPDEDGGTSDEEEEVPACVKKNTAGTDNDPARECFGALTLKILGKQGRWVRVLVLGMSGLPWVGGSGGLMLEVGIEPGGKPRWLVLPHAHGPDVNAKLETVVKVPREIKGKKRFLVKVGVWVCGRVWRHAALGQALMPLGDPGPPTTALLLQRSQLTEDLGVVEVTLRCDYGDDLMKQVVSTSSADVVLTLEVLRARCLRPFNPGLRAKAKQRSKKEHAEVVVRVGLWVKGERVEKVSSNPVQLPVTRDPVIRNRSTFTIPRDQLQHAAIILKVVYSSRWCGEDTVGRVQLGPLLYLGTAPDPAVPQPDYNTSITLSHWGTALKTPGPSTMWHYLQE